MTPVRRPPTRSSAACSARRRGGRHDDHVGPNELDLVAERVALTDSEVARGGRDRARHRPRRRGLRPRDGARQLCVRYAPDRMHGHTVELL